MLLVEEGVRSPGGLQGNVEYITFEREAPEKAFGKIVEMIAALAPRAKPIGSAETGTAPPDVGTDKDSDASYEEAWAVPSVEWKRADYEFALLKAIFFKKEHLIDKLSEAYLATESGTIEANSQSWQAAALYLRTVYGGGSHLDELRKMADRWAANSSVVAYLARSLEYYEQYADAAVLFMTAADNEKHRSERIKYLRGAADAYRKNGKDDAARGVLETMRQEGQDSDEREILAVQRELTESSNEDDLWLATLERLVDLEPDDENQRFSLAYKYSNTGNEPMALFHYLRIPVRYRTEWVWNNLGVAFDQLKLPGKSVYSYRKAEEMNNTLAMSNLSNKLMNAGFLEEATKICNTAIGQEDFHKNIGHSLSRLKEIPEQEETKEQELVGKARPLSEFYKSLGRGIARVGVSSLTKKWRGPDAILEASYEEYRLYIKGEYSRDTYNLLSFMGSRSSGGITDQESQQRFQIIYSARSNGRAFVGTVVRKRVDNQAGLSALSAPANSEATVLMVLSDDGQQFDVLEKVDGKDVQRYKLLASLA